MQNLLCEITHRSTRSASGYITMAIRLTKREKLLHTTRNSWHRQPFSRPWTWYSSSFDSRLLKCIVRYSSYLKYYNLSYNIISRMISSTAKYYANKKHLMDVSSAKLYSDVGLWSIRSSVRNRTRIFPDIDSEPVRPTFRIWPLHSYEQTSPNCH